MFTEHSIRSRRRRRLTRLALTSSSLLLVSFLAACAPPAAPPSSAGSSDATLTVGVQGSSTESIDPQNGGATVSGEMRTAQLFEGLTRLSPKGEVEWGLAVGMTPNSTADEWTIKLRPDVKFQDGSPFGADDVIAMIKRSLDPKTASFAASVLNFVDPNGITKVDDLTVRVKLLHPYGPFKQVWTSTYLLVAKKGTAGSAHPVGTGPFTFSRFAPGSESMFTRFDGYWGDKARVKRLKIVDFKTADAELNALRGGQIDIAQAVPFTSVRSLKGLEHVRLLRSKTQVHIDIAMRTDIAPFKDVRVRQAIRLIANRRQMVDNALDGNGSIANDFVGRFGDCTPPDLPQRKQDLKKARSLLEEAGETGLKATLTTTKDQPGMLEMAQIFAEDAKKAGVDISVNLIGTDQFLDKWGEWPMATDFSSSDFLSYVPSHFLPDGGANTTHWNDSEFVALTNTLYRTSDQEKRCDIQRRLQKIEYGRGGYIRPVWIDRIDAYRDNVHGLVPDVQGKAAYRLSRVSLG